MGLLAEKNSRATIGRVIRRKRLRAVREGLPAVLALAAGTRERKCALCREATLRRIPKLLFWHRRGPLI